MTKTLIAGLATIVVAGSALIGTGLYAGTGTSTTTSIQGAHMAHQTPEQLVASLSGKVSTEAITAFTTLMTRHKAEMDTLRSNTGTTLDKTAMQAKHTAFKAEIDALMVKYPELKAALPAPSQGGKMGGRGGKMGGKNNAEVDAIIATLPVTAQAELKSIRESYQTKEQTLRTEEKSKIDAVLAVYPEAKAKLDALKANQPNDRQGRGSRGNSMR